MQRKIKIIIILLIVLGLIIVVYFVLNKYIFADVNQIKNPKAREANDYLAQLKGKITPNYWSEIVKAGNEFGFESNILANLSAKGSASDYESFSQIRKKIYNYIALLSNLKQTNVAIDDSAQEIKASIASSETASTAANDFLPAFGCENNSNSSCLDFGSEVEIQSGWSFEPSKLNSPRSEGGITYRSLKTKENLKITLPAFNVEADGTLKSNMLLEIRYKDTLPYDQNDKQFNYDERALVKSKINYIAKEKSLYGYVEKNIKASSCPSNQKSDNAPNECYPSDKLDYAISYLGEKGDNNWKYLQVPLLKSDSRHLPLLKGEDGKFIFYLTMPKKTYINNDLPLDYLNLRIISKTDYQALDALQREARGQKEAEFSDNGGGNLQANAAENMVIYSRDLMRPVYEESTPRQNEIKKELNLYSAIGEIETGNFAIYAKSQVQNLSFKPSSLTFTNENGSIGADRIKFYQVKEARRTISDEKFDTYAQVPDQLDYFNAATLQANTSTRFVFEVNIPDNTPGGQYTGEIEMIKDGQVIDKIKLNLNLLPIKLENPAINFTYGDPTNITLAQNLDELYGFYKDFGLGYLIKIHPHDFNINGTDLGQFRERLADLKKRGILLKKQPLDIENLIEEIYKSVYPGKDLTDRELYQKLNDNKFKQVFSLFLKRLEDLAQEQGIKFVYLAVDEPSTIQKRIIADRVYPLFQDKSQETMVTLVESSVRELDKNVFTDFDVPQNKLPLKSLAEADIDYKFWNLRMVDQSFGMDYSNNFSYYTTKTSYFPTAVNNRFLHGWYAYKTGANLIYAYAAAGGWMGDPFRDFDSTPNYDRFNYKADHILAYPAWDGKLHPTIAALGLREGIKDLKYIATLKKLIELNKDKVSPSPSTSPSSSKTPSPSPSASGFEKTVPPSPSPKASGWQ